MELEKVPEGVAQRVNRAGSKELHGDITISVTTDIYRAVADVETDLRIENAGLIADNARGVAVAMHDGNPIARAWLWDCGDYTEADVMFVDIAWGDALGVEAIHKWAEKEGYPYRTRQDEEAPDFFISIDNRNKVDLYKTLMHAPFMSTFKYLNIGEMIIKSQPHGAWQIELSDTCGSFIPRTLDCPDSYDEEDICYIIRKEVDSQTVVYRAHDPQCICGADLESSDNKESGDSEWKYCPACGRLLIWVGPFEGTCSECGDYHYNYGNTCEFCYNPEEEV